MRTGGRFQVGIVDPTLNTRILPDLFGRATRIAATVSGADSLWAPDHLIQLLPTSLWRREYTSAAVLAPDGNAQYDPWTTLSYTAARTCHRRLLLGVGVTDTGRRNPAVIAQAAAGLHLLSRGRFVLGIGPGERENNVPYGVDWRRPVARFEEALATIRTLWDSKGEAVSRDSEFFPLHDAVFGLPPYRGTRPPVWIGAHGPRMLRAVGRFGDGWLPAFSQQPNEYGKRLAAIRAAAQDAGRDPLAITPAAIFFVFPGRTRRHSQEVLDSVPARAFALCASAQVWAGHGVEHPLGADFAGLQDIMPHTLTEQQALRCAEQVPDALLGAEFPNGTPADIVDRIAEYRNHGLRHAVLVNMSVLHPNLSAGLGSAIPFITAIRQLRRM